MLNELLVEGGYATVYRFPSDVRHEQRLRDAEDRAREAGAGLWTACETEDADEADDEDEVVDEGSEGECDSAYPDVCIPPPPPDLDLWRPRVQRHPRAVAGPAQPGCRRGRRRLPELKSERYASPATSGESGASSLCSSGSTSCANRRMLRSACSADMPP